MEKKIAIITGANSGIGKETAIVLAQKNFKVIMFGRSQKASQLVQEEIKEKTDNQDIYFIYCDLASLNSVRSAVSEFKSQFSRLDVLINNAGVNVSRREITEDGYEKNFAINHLGPFLLTNLLLDVLKQSAPSRIITLTSSGQSSINFDDLMGEQKFSWMRAYTQSKLANVLFTYELARKLEGTGVTANCVHPGVVRTNLVRDMSWYFKIIYHSVLKWFFKTPRKGAETSIYLATSPDLESVSGKYFVNKKEAISHNESYNEAYAQTLWEKSSKLVHLN